MTLAPGARVRRTAYDLSARECRVLALLAPTGMVGTVVSVTGGIVEVQWDHRTKGKTNRYYADGLRVEILEAAA